MHLKIRWRIIAALALVVYGLVVFLLVRLLAHNFAFAFLLGISLTVLLYLIWRMFSSNQRSGWYTFGLVVGAAALITELVYFLTRKGNLRAVVGVLIFSAIYVGLIGLLRKVYWREARHIGQLTHKTGHFQRPYLIINPKSGDGRAMKAHVDELARDQGIQVSILQKGYDVESIARHAVASGADVLGISGGDGSIGAVAKVALESDVPMVVLPGGTRCHFARDLGLQPEQITDALAGFTGVERRIDVGEINNRIFLNNVSFGMYADIVNNPDYRENKLQVSRDVIRSLVTGQKEPYDLKFHNDTRQFDKAAQVLVGVNRYKTMSLLELGQRKKLDGGVLQVTAITRINDTLLRGLLKTVTIDWLRKQTELPDFYQWDAKTFSVASGKRAIVVGVDGEREIFTTPVTIRILPGALRIFVPAEGIRNRPKEAFSKDTVKHVWRGAAHANPS